MKKAAGMILLCAALLVGCGEKTSGEANVTTANSQQESSTQSEAQTSTEAVTDGAPATSTAAEAGNDKSTEAATQEPGDKVKESQETKGEESQAVSTEVATDAPAAPVSHSGYLFQIGSTVIGMNEDSAPYLAALGASNDYFESESCAFQGLDKTYTYSGFELYTYPNGAKDMVNSINLLDATVSTPEGLKIGSAEADIVAAYGDGYVLENGVYQYTKDKSILTIFVTGGVVDGIEYTAITK